MAYRLYLTNEAAAAAPTVSSHVAWDDITGRVSRRLGVAKSGAAAVVSRAETSTSSTWDVLLYQGISDPILSAGVLQGNSRYAVGVRESSTSANFISIAFITVWDSSCTVMRGLHTGVTFASEWPTTATGYLLLNETAANQTAVACSVGDRLVFEVGFRSSNTVSTSFTGHVNYGATGATDLAQGSTAVTTNPGWIEFDDPGVGTMFDPPPYDPTQFLPFFD